MAVPDADRRLIAALANIGLNNKTRSGWSASAANATPEASETLKASETPNVL